ncbi:type II secretion system protein GspG [Congregibacter sp.]|uniref:type II secretion system protein GspG n=1 Tax=Congregibacter sp. TaxID=2744308 RepID=UPI00385FC3AC
MLLRLSMLFFLALLGGCATYTAEYQERLVRSLPNQRDVTIHDSKTYPGDILCGSFSRLSSNGFTMRRSKFVVGVDMIITAPTKEDVLVYCGSEPEQALFELTGIGVSDQDWAPLVKVRDDMLLIDAAITRYYDARATLPDPLNKLLEDDYGVEPENLIDPWGRPYNYEGGLSGRTVPQYKLSSYGANGTVGGRYADADVRREQTQMLNHVLRINGY